MDVESNFLSGLSDMIREAERNAGNVDDWVFLCHPSFCLASLKEFEGHEVCALIEAPKGAVYFSKDFRKDDLSDLCNCGAAGYRYADVSADQDWQER